ncbi:MAG: hypothetical protein BWY32_03443 [bacterium ADurb.Bin243]|nr:MAG: hypothetical protein BWY32_03443 [bacterium ADurb.Bin243]
MKKTLYFIITLHFIIAVSLFSAHVFNSFAATDEQKYDSTQWYFKARYLYEQRKDFEGAKKAIIKACELDFDNAEAFAYMQILSGKIKLAIPEKFKLKIPQYEGKSGSARHWYVNGVEAFNRGDHSGALFCFEQAVKNDLTNEQVAYMLNAAKREIALIKLREKIEGRFESVSRFDKSLAPEPAASAEVQIEDGKADDAFANYKDKYLSIKTAKRLLESGTASYDPKKFSEWLGFARYIYTVNKDEKNALLAIDTALLFYGSNETALKLKEEIAQKVKIAEEAEKERQRKEKEAVEQARLKRLEQEKNSRSVPVSEIIISEKPSAEADKEVKVTGDFTDEDFIMDTSEAKAGEEEVVAPSNKPVALPVGEIVLVNDRQPSVERKKLIEETKSYVIRHSKLANDKYTEGKLHEALLEYEKIYEKILQIDPNDVKSLYNMVLLYKKMGEQRNAQQTFIRLVNAINETSAKYSGSRNIQKIYHFVDCTVKASIVNAAVLAYNQKNYYPMNRSNFDMSKLKEQKYLVIDEGEDREIMLSLVENSLTNQIYKTYKFVVSGHSCKAGGKYSIGANGVVSCSVHGDSVIILSGQELDKVNYGK